MIEIRIIGKKEEVLKFCRERLGVNYQFNFYRARGGRVRAYFNILDTADESGKVV